jgi:hypothetical protein
MVRTAILLLALVATLLLRPEPASAQLLELAQRGGEVRASDRDRERARLACRDEARRQNFTVRGSTPARELDDRHIRLRMELTRGDRRWLGTCTYDARARRAELEARRVESGRPDRPGGRPGRPGGSASTEKVRDACIREVTRNARTQLVAAGRVERRSSGASVMPMTINVEGMERRVRCFYDNATGAGTIRWAPPSPIRGHR